MRTTEKAHSGFGLPLVRCRTTSQPPDGAKRSPAVSALFEDRLAPFYRRRTPLADWESISQSRAALTCLASPRSGFVGRYDLCTHREPSLVLWCYSVLAFALLPQFIRSLSEPLADGANDTLERCAETLLCTIVTTYNQQHTTHARWCSAAQER